MTHTVDVVGLPDTIVLFITATSHHAQVKPDALGSNQVAQSITIINHRARGKQDVVGITIHKIARR